MANYIERYWRDATPQDAIREPPMMARFRDDAKYEWRINPLRGIRQGAEFPWFSEAKGSFEYCQVYDAPDPGEGWRLIDPAKEEWQQGDEIYERSTGTWRTRLTGFQGWALSINRRRIEQPKPEPRYEPFRWEDREQLRGRWIYQVGDENAEQMINKIDFAHNEFYANNKSARQLLNDWLFLDTGEPVGRRVE